jgi:hypothetical protein
MEAYGRCSERVVCRGGWAATIKEKATVGSGVELVGFDEALACEFIAIGNTLPQRAEAPAQVAPTTGFYKLTYNARTLSEVPAQKAANHAPQAWQPGTFDKAV